MKKAFYLTKSGKADLQNELDTLIAKRGEIADAIATARSQGDLAENSEYQAAKDEQARHETRISEIEHILLNAEIIKAPKGDTKVRLGATVTLKGGGNKTKQFQVVGTVEADPLNGKISDESPIGKALIGKKVGEEVEIKTPAETTTYTISEIG
jgi:transcription elongation factor GreA